MRWIITQRRHHDRIVDGGILPPRLEVSTLPDVLRVMLSRSFKDYDVWYVSPDGTPQKTAAGSVPGRAPGDWFHFKYTPAPVELLLIQQNVPTGTFEDVKFLSPSLSEPRRSVQLNFNEIEAALVHSDLSRFAVDTALSYLPDLTLFYNYLETKGALKAIRQIQRLLTY